MIQTKKKIVTILMTMKDIDRFITKVVRDGSCWRGTGSSKRGYGYFWVGPGKKTVLAHRWSFEFFKHKLGCKGDVVCHICDNPWCVNPMHLYEGTQTDNMRECSDKGRIKNGRSYEVGKCYAVE